MFNNEDLKNSIEDAIKRAINDKESAIFLELEQNFNIAAKLLKEYSGTYQFEYNGEPILYSVSDHINESQIHVFAEYQKIQVQVSIVRCKDMFKPIKFDEL